MFCYFLYILLRLGRSWESPDRVRRSERRGGGSGAAAPPRAVRGRGRGAVSTSATTENSASGRASRPINHPLGGRGRRVESIQYVVLRQPSAVCGTSGDRAEPSKQSQTRLDVQKSRTRAPQAKVNFCNYIKLCLAWVNTNLFARHYAETLLGRRVKMTLEKAKCDALVAAAGALNVDVASLLHTTSSLDARAHSDFPADAAPTKMNKPLGYISLPWRRRAQSLGTAASPWRSP